MRQEKEISKNFYRFWRMSNLRGFLGRCAKVVANSKFFYNFGSMRQNVGELRKKSSPKFGFAKRCRIDPKFGASTQKASQIRHSPNFALFSGFKLWRIVRSPDICFDTVRCVKRLQIEFTDFYYALHARLETRSLFYTKH